MKFLLKSAHSSLIMIISNSETFPHTAVFSPINYLINRAEIIEIEIIIIIIIIN